MSWGNKEWIQVYGCLRELIVMYDLQHQTNPDTRQFATQVEVAAGLIAKLEEIFDDSAPEKPEVQSTDVSRDWNY